MSFGDGALDQESPAPGGHRLLRNWDAQQEVSSRLPSEASPASPHPRKRSLAPKRLGTTALDDFFLKTFCGASLVVQWLRVCGPVRGTRVQALVWEDPTCRRAARPVSHNY